MTESFLDATRQRRPRDSSEKQYVCPQPGCNKKFYHTFNLYRHQRIKGHRSMVPLAPSDNNTSYPPNTPTSRPDMKPQAQQEFLMRSMITAMMSPMSSGKHPIALLSAQNAAQDDSSGSSSQDARQTPETPLGAEQALNLSRANHQ